MKYHMFWYAVNTKSVTQTEALVNVIGKIVQVSYPQPYKIFIDKTVKRMYNYQAAF